MLSLIMITKRLFSKLTWIKLKVEKIMPKKMLNPGLGDKNGEGMLNGESEVFSSQKVQLPFNFLTLAKVNEKGLVKMMRTLAHKDLILNLRRRQKTIKIFIHHFIITHHHRHSPKIIKANSN